MIPRPLEILAVAGFQIKLEDGSDFWRLVKSVDDIDNTNLTDRTWDENDASGVQDDDLLNKDIIICYSWGVASVFKAFDRLRSAGKMPNVSLLVIMAGVPRGIGQCVKVTVDGGWVVPSEVGEAVCLQVNSVPASHPIANSSATRLNILITGIPGNDHVGIQDFPAAHDVIVNLIAGIAAALGSPPANLQPTPLLDGT